MARTAPERWGRCEDGRTEASFFATLQGPGSRRKSARSRLKASSPFGSRSLAQEHLPALKRGLIAKGLRPSRAQGIQTKAAASTRLPEDFSDAIFRTGPLARSLGLFCSEPP